MRKTKETLRSKCSVKIQGTLRALMVCALLISSLTLVGCKRPKRQEIQATIWLNNSPLRAEICEKYPELYEHGFYRKINDTQFEFVSFCDSISNEWLSIHKDDFNRLLDKYVPEDRQDEVR